MSRIATVLGALVLVSAAACAAPTEDTTAPEGTSQDEVHAFSSVTELATIQGGAPLRTTATHAYFRSASRATTAIARVALGGGPVETFYTVDQGDDVGDFVIDGAEMFVVVLHANGMGALAKIPLATGQATTLVAGTGLSNMAALTTDATHVYVASRSDVVRLSKAGVALAPESIAEKQEDAFGIAVDGSNVYWATHGKGNPAIGCTPGEGIIHVRPKSGGPERALVTGEDCPVWLGISGGTLTWRTFLGQLRSVSTAGGWAWTTAAGVMSYDATSDGAALYYAATTPFGNSYIFRSSKLVPVPMPIASTRISGRDQIIETVQAAGRDVLYVQRDREANTTRLMRLR